VFPRKAGTGIDEALHGQAPGKIEGIAGERIDSTGGQGDEALITGGKRLGGDLGSGLSLLLDETEGAP
jgi:hypothetical protein